jgi:hypothetical protein
MIGYKNIAIHTKTQEEWDQITELFDIKWNYGSWEIHKEESVILILDESFSIFNTHIGALNTLESLTSNFEFCFNNHIGANFEFCSIHWINDINLSNNIHPASQIIRDIKLNKIIKD